MSIDTSNSELKDDIVAAVAGVLVVANQCARDRGVNLEESLISIEQQDDDVNLWRVNYGPKKFLNVRGGDLYVYVDASTKSVSQVLLGQ